MNSFFSSFLDLWFPKRCVGCNAFDCWMCEACIQQHLQIEYQQCTEEATQLDGFDSVTTLGQYSNPFWRKAITTVKFNSVQEVGYTLSELLSFTVLQYLPLTLPLPGIHKKSFQLEPPLMVIPIPLHKKRLRERGFNQTRLLAESFQSYGIPVNEHILLRKTHTPSQTTLAHEQRSSNVEGVFELSSHDMSNKQGSTIILIDDVITTGSTVRQAARTLRKLQPAAIHVVAVARG